MKDIADYRHGERVSVESSYPGIFLDSVTHLRSGTDFALVLCVLPEGMIDGSEVIEAGDILTMWRLVAKEFEDR